MLNLQSLSEIQAEFAEALRNPAAAIPAGIVGPDGGPAPKRFSIYRNNVLVALGNSLAGAFPAVKRIVGEDFFKVMARTYVLESPPTSPVLMDNPGLRTPETPANTFSPSNSGTSTRSTGLQTRIRRSAVPMSTQLVSRRREHPGT